MESLGRKLTAQQRSELAEAIGVAEDEWFGDYEIPMPRREYVADRISTLIEEWLSEPPRVTPGRSDE